MRLTPEEVIEINRYLFNYLKQNGFDVKLSSKGYIKNVSKFGVDCLPGVCHSYVDGKQEYSYLCLEAGKMEPSDLGYYCENIPKCALSVYTKEKPVKIDIKNYKTMIDKFINQLNSDYMTVVRSNIQNEGLLPKVKIKATGDIFDGKFGRLEEETDDKVTVLVDFDGKGRKVRQYFKKDNIERIEPEHLFETVKEEDFNIKNKPLKEEDETDLEVVNITDEKIILLAEELNIPPLDILSYIDYHGRDAGDWYKNVYVVLDKETEEVDREYLVCNSREAENFARNNAEDYVNDNGLGSIDYFMDFVDTDYFDTMHYEYEESTVNDYTDDDLILEALDAGILTESDFEENEEGDIDTNNIETLKPRINLDDVREKLIDKRVSGYDNGLEWAKELYSENELEDMVRERGLVDMDGLVNNLISNGYGEWLSSYDNQELYLGETDSGEELYAYRII